MIVVIFIHIFHPFVIQSPYFFVHSFIHLWSFVWQTLTSVLQREKAFLLATLAALCAWKFTQNLKKNCKIKNSYITGCYKILNK